MIRSIAVLLVAVLCALLFGVDGQIQAQQPDAARRKLEARVARLKVGDMVTVRLLDGTKVEGLLAGHTPDSVDVDVYRRRTFRRPSHLGIQTFALGDIRDIKTPLTTAQRALLATAIVAGTCAIAGAVVSQALGAERHESPPIDSSTDPDGDRLGPGAEGLAPSGAAVEDGRH